MSSVWQASCDIMIVLFVQGVDHLLARLSLATQIYEMSVLFSCLDKHQDVT